MKVDLYLIVMYLCIKYISHVISMISRSFGALDGIWDKKMNEVSIGRSDHARSHRHAEGKHCRKGKVWGMCVGDD